VTGYDDILDAYLAHIERPDSWNNLYERPSFKTLLPPLKDKSVLDLGCASGYYIDHAFAQGAAAVTAVDIARGWLARLEARSPDPRLRLVQADISEPMPFLADTTFDVAILSLVIHYIRHWEPLLAELYRVLKPGGRVVISTHHPQFTWKLFHRDDLRDVFEVEDTWAKDTGRPFPVRYWVRSLTETLQPLLRSDFRVLDVLEPPPDESLKQDHPETYARLRREPAFLFIVLEK
jgi:SAM-dependent methyltransferase